MKLFLFDNDGTILQGLGPYETALEQAIKEEFREELEISLEGFHGFTDRKILSEILRQNNIDFTEKSIDKCLANFGELYTASRDSTNLLPNVEETLKELKKRENILGLLTGNVEKMARKKLSLYDLNPLLPFGAFGEESCKREELADIALQRARTHGWDGNKKQAYVIGDTPIDMKAALTAEVVPIGITTGKFLYKELEEAGAGSIIQNLSELLTLQ